METAGKFVEDEELAEAMKERGLGTPATRADTIDGLDLPKIHAIAISASWCRPPKPSN